MALILPTLPGLTWPRDISFGAFDTTVQTSVSGKISAYANKVNPTRRYTLSYSGLDSSGNNQALLNNSMQLLQGFFLQCRGRLLPFQYEDTDDYIATGQTIGIGDGATKKFQLVRNSFGFTEQVFAPTNVPSIFVGGSLKAPVADYTIDRVGRVNFIVAPAASAVITWSGTYNWICHWDSDTLDMSNFMDGYYEVKDISFTTRIL
jgi:uncharacterized protein (TIGR02217 family)